MRPLALWLLRHGVPYPEFAELLKSVFLEAARSELARSTRTDRENREYRAAAGPARNPGN